MANRGRPVIQMSNNPQQGFKCCCCQCCACMDLSYLRSRNGFIKLLEAILGSLCQSMLIEFGLPEASSIGSAFHGFLTTVNACVLTTFLLIVCYIFSPKSQYLVRQSTFEFVFNTAACLLYLSAASCLAAAVNVFLYPKFMAFTMYSAYPAMTAVYYIGGVLGLIHGMDAYLAYRYYKGYR